MIVNVGDYIRQKAIKNLLYASERIADEGNVNSVIALSKFMLKLSKHFDKKFLDFGLENGNECADNPPDKS